MLSSVFSRSPKKCLSLVCLLVVLVSACEGAPQKVNIETVDFFTDNGLSNAVSTIQHPAGEYHQGITYVAYQGPLEDPYIAAYNHQTQTWQGPFKAGISDMGKDPNRKKKIDNHGKPAMIIDDQGYIHIVFGGHGGTPDLGKNRLGNYHYGRMQHAVSKKPLDITSWETLDNISPFGTYNQLIKLDNGDIYLFYRHGAHRSNWVYQKSTDHGRTFGEPVSILKSQRRKDVKAVDAWYAWFGKAPNGKIIANVNYHMCWDMSETHTGERRNGYYIEMDPRDEIWRNVQGEALQTPITRALANEKARVLDSGELWTNITTAHMDNNGKPHVVFRMGEHMGMQHGGPQKLYHFRWSGQSWAGDKTTDLPVAQGDMKIDSDGDIKLFLASRNADNHGEVAVWRSQDSGESFAKEKVYITREKTNFAITSHIRNAHPDARIIVAGRVRDTDYRKMYLLGDNGPVTRPMSEATVLK